MCSPGTTALWEQDVAYVLSGSNYAEVALASDESAGDGNMSSWRTAGLNAATSGADGKLQRAFKRARSSGPRGSFTLTDRVISWVLICAEG